LFPMILALANGVVGAAIAFFVAGLWEIGEPARKALIVDLAHESVRGRSIGIYYLIRNLTTFPTALIGGLIPSVFWPQYVFFTAFGVGMLGFLTYAVWGADDDPQVRNGTIDLIGKNGTGPAQEGR